MKKMSTNDLILNRQMTSNRHFLKEDLQMVNKSLQKCSSLLIIRKRKCKLQGDTSKHRFQQILETVWSPPHQTENSMEALQTLREKSHCM